MKNILLILILILAGSTVSAQFITVTEIDESGNSRILTRNREVVDFNSKLAIDIQRNKIYEKLDTSALSPGGNSIDSLLLMLGLYEKFLNKLDEEIADYQELFEGDLKSVPVGQLDNALSERATAGLAIAEFFASDEVFMEKWEQKLSRYTGSNTNEEYRILLELLDEKISHVESDLGRIVSESGYSFQMGAWLINKEGSHPIHMDGFDEIPLGEYFNVERHTLYITEAQLSEFQRFQALFENRENGSFIDKALETLPGILNSFIDEEAIEIQLEKLVTDITSLATNAQAEKTRLLNQAILIKDNFELLKSNIKLKIDEYTSPAGMTSAQSKMDVLHNFLRDLNQVKSQVNNLTDDIKALVDGTAIQTLGANANAIKAEFINLQSLLSSSISDLVEWGKNGIEIALHGRSINSAALEITEKVLKLQLDQIPASTMLDMNYAGPREAGDLVVVKALLWKNGESSPVAVETHEFPIMNALPHLEMSIVYSFAKPNLVETNWKGGPLVSILYKFKSRSLPYRNFLDAGIGLHAASYDFNNDDTPEFAGGIVASIFKDYLQFGWGFNFNADCAYWFAGLRIPIPSSPVSLMGTQ